MAARAQVEIVFPVKTGADATSTINASRFVPKDLYTDDVIAEIGAIKADTLPAGKRKWSNITDELKVPLLCFKLKNKKQATFLCLPEKVEDAKNGLIGKSVVVGEGTGDSASEIDKFVRQKR